MMNNFISNIYKKKINKKDVCIKNLREKMYIFIYFVFITFLLIVVPQITE